MVPFAAALTISLSGDLIRKTAALDDNFLTWIFKKEKGRGRVGERCVWLIPAFNIRGKCQLSCFTSLIESDSLPPLPL